MIAVRQLIRDLNRTNYNNGEGGLWVSEKDWKALKAKYADKPAKKIPAKRAKQRRNRETPAEHEAVILQLFERAQGECEGARIRRDDDGYTVVTTGDQGSGILKSMVRANGLIILSEEVTKVRAGGMVTVQLLDDSLDRMTEPGY